MPLFSVLANGVPTDKLKTDLARFFDLSDEQLNRLASYLTDSKNPLPTNLSDISKVSDTVGVDVSLLSPQLNLLRYILGNWRRSGAQMGDIANELTALGYEGEAHDRAKGFLEKVGIVKEKFFIVDARGEAEVSGLPTIDEMSLVWDIRPIFESVDWSPNEKGDGPVTAVWLAHSNMLILEIMSSNREGKKESLSVQLSEDEFRELERLVGVARKQLDVIHAKRFI